ncbi:tRNA (5-methylaminomethyl-2-thiouridylate)-methyltransferase [Raphidocelis subcapitata]|uniref:tRNA-5-taurinomethyluridine 2-sulfurtransferase n=1 Tax=Raphidocelis subcapitata TaxID=307507 RepID=A0A2V0PFE3_9CHLO|nr:tRNA (5-methylaminomethyl-2-thiouridylate)-methyltransferase [Raphidocelis subcapitata]|eukprot:GBF98571.1 tRNA (5-methylaminomethyl-2-thiouridylate)-methyltransferase [Raphidocelis subcapitata]
MALVAPSRPAGGAGAPRRPRAPATRRGPPPPRAAPPRSAAAAAHNTPWPAQRACATAAAGPRGRRMLAVRCERAQPPPAAPPPPPRVLGGLSIEPLEAPAGTGTGDGDGGGGAPGAAPLPPVPPLSQWGADAGLIAGCEPGRRLRVAVLVSGGVDSSVALQLVRAAGHEAVAFYLQIWFQEDFRNFWDACPWEEDLSYARQVCDSVGVPLEVVPMTEQYWSRVVAHSVGEIKAGRTPNPDMLCNSRVKFGAFLEWLDETQPGRFDRVASGHYARLLRPEPDAAAAAAAAAADGGGEAASADEERRRSGGAASGSGRGAGADGAHLGLAGGSVDSSSNGSGGGGSRSGGVSSSGGGLDSSSAVVSSTSSSSSSSGGGGVRLALTPDAVKDQTYFLAQLSPAQLARTMFPLGALTKAQVRALAVAAGLATSGRKDSQGICFLGKVKFGEFVREHLGAWPGPLVEAESGAAVGAHEGYWFYTVGQRGGIRLPGGPWYVVAKDMALNVVTISRAYHAPEKRRDAFAAGPLNWLSPARPRADGGPLLVKVRHGPNTAGCRLLLGTAAEVGEWARRAAELGGGSGSEGGGESSGSGGGGGAAGWHAEDLAVGAEPAGSAAAAAAGVGGGGTGGEQYGLVLLEERDQGLAAGQYAVFYQDGVCLGAAKIAGAVGSAEAAEALAGAAAAAAEAAGGSEGSAVALR